MTVTADLSLNEWMTRGGDGRIVLDPETGLNHYFSAPFPRDVLALASSTSNDLSPEANAHLAAQYPGGAAHLGIGAAYRECLDGLRQDIRNAYQLGQGNDIFFAASGTDLEYVGLLAVAGQREGGIVNLLLGADEVGSGCIHSAAGNFFASETPLGVNVTPEQPVAGLPPIDMEDAPVRCEAGEARPGAYLCAQMARAIQLAGARDMSALVHVVHGSKTGLVLPRLADIESLQARFGDDVTFVVDACQARITTEAVHAYLDRGMIVFVTGSKFMGGPPFSGFALLPNGMAQRAAPLASGMAQIFRRAEIPESWPGRDMCEDTGNPGLALRLAASIHELARFQALGMDRVARVVAAFTRATDTLASKLDIHKVASAPAAQADNVARHPIEMQTLVTLDLTRDNCGAPVRNLSFEDSTRMHRALVAQDIRLGQPVRCVRRADGSWGGTLRIGLSMPQICQLDALEDTDLAAHFEAMMKRVGIALSRQLVP